VEWRNRDPRLARKKKALEALELRNLDHRELRPQIPNSERVELMKATVSGVQKPRYEVRRVCLLVAQSDVTYNRRGC